MKILIIRNYPNYMDVKFNTYNIQEIGLAKALVRKGHICDIVFWSDKAEMVDYVFDGDKHINVFYRTGKSYFKNAIIDNIDSLVENYDIIQPCEYNQYQSLLLAKRFPDKTVIYHGPYYSEFNKRYNIFCKVFDTLFIKHYIRLGTKFNVKSHLAAQFLSDKGIDRENINVVGVGIDADALHVEKLETVPAEIIKISKIVDRFKILYVGKFEERRNIEFMFRMFKGFSEKNDDSVLIMVGTGNREYVQHCMNLAESLQISDKIYRIERAEQKFLSEIYKVADCFVLPTSYEIFGMVLIEAMYFKLPTITTLNGGSEMLIDDGRDGFIIKDLNEADWVDTLEKIYKNKTVNFGIGDRANAKIRNHFTWDGLVDKIMINYEDVINRGTSL